MKNLNHTQLKILSIVSLLCLIIPVSIYSLWIYVIDLGTNQAERVVVFKSYFPEILHGRWSTTLLSIFFCVLAIILNTISNKASRTVWKSLNRVIVFTGSLLLFLNLFSMM